MSAEPSLPDREVPHNLEAEASVLGSLLLAPERFPEIEGRVQPEDFFSPAYGAAFQGMINVSRQGKPIDILVMKDELDREGTLDLVGGAAGLSALLDAVPTGAHVEHYARIVRDKAILRRLASAATEIVQKVGEGADSASDLVDFAEQSVFNIAATGNSKEAQGIADVLKQTWEKIEQYHQDNRTVTGIPTGFYQMDELTAGLHGGEMIIVAGRPAMGKSSFALNLMRHVTVDYGYGAILFSLEMTAENIARNLLCAQSRVDAQRLRTGQLHNEDWQMLIQSSDELSQAPIYIDDTPGITLAELRGKCRRLKARSNLGLIVIDYLQLITASSLASNRSREQEISEISRGLKRLSMELDVPVIALSQLNRKAEGRSDNRPILSDLRESGAIEQDADMVLLVHRPDYYDPNDCPGEAEIIIAKQRNGPTDTVNLVFLKNRLRFENPSIGTPPPPQGGGAPAGAGAIGDGDSGEDEL